MTKPKPDFTRLQKVLMRKGEPDRVPFYELFVDIEIIEAVINKPLTKLDLNKKDDTEQYWKWVIKFYHLMGYDYVPVSLTTKVFPQVERLQAPDTAFYPRAARLWVDQHHGVIETRNDFEKYPWPTIENVDFYPYEIVAKNLPEGMAMIANGPGGVLENVMWLMGYEPMSYALYEDEELIQNMFDKVGSLLVKIFDTYCQMDKCIAVALGDDMGFKTQTMFSPQVLRKYVFPWHKKIADVVHKHNLPIILHSCGNLESVMDDLINFVGIDAKHSYEDIIMPVSEAKRKYGNKIAILGGVDVDKLARLTEDDLRKYVRNIIKECAPGGGYALGSGNSVTNYVKLENYLAMLDEGLKYGVYPIKC